MIQKKIIIEAGNEKIDANTIDDYIKRFEEGAITEQEFNKSFSSFIKETESYIDVVRGGLSVYGAAAAFVAAATPIPDDLVYVPLGLAKYNPRRFFISTLLGKLLLCYILVLSSHYLSDSIVDPIFASFGITSADDLDNPWPILVGIIVFGVSMTIVVILLLRLDWSKILGRFMPWTLEDDDDQK